MANLLQTQLSTQILHFRPGRSPQSFEVTVQNQSQQFATFQIELIASGVSSQVDSSWYSLAPDLSAKIPPGDRTHFTVTILDVPPVPGGFVGTMTLAVRVFSLELRQEDRQVLNLVIEGSGITPPQVQLAAEKLTVSPNASVEIPVRLLNPNRSVITVDLSLRGLPLDWLPDGNERRLQLPPKEETSVVFLCQIPSPMEAPSQAYTFEVEARVTAATITRASTILTVLPDGHIEFTVTPVEQKFPLAKSKPVQPAIWNLEFDNQSNLTQEITITTARQQRIFWFSDPNSATTGNGTPPALLYKTDRIAAMPDTVHLEAGGIAPVELQLGVKRPWLGWVRHQQFQISPVLSDDRITLRPPSRTITLHVIPQIRVWLQLLVLSVLAGFLLLPLLGRTSHRGAVNTVQFDGLGNQVVSGSDDQTVRRWVVNQGGLRRIDQPADDDKAVRVVRYRPLNNNAVAIGFENGEIRLVNLLDRTQTSTMLYQQDDRVFDLEFSPDARSLFSGHGSGQVLRWDALNPPSTVVEPEQRVDVGFAIQDLALAGVQSPQLAIAGRFNRLVLWNWQTDTIRSVNYPSGGRTAYITSLDTAAQNPNLLVTSDNQGRITLWDLSTCLNRDADCRQLDGWRDGHGGQPVQSVALSANACYLASGGDDGRVMLWFLDSDGRVLEGRSLGQFPQPINSVDVIQRGNQVLVVSGGSNRQVRIYSVRHTNDCREN
jgi:WD40 repeat protein